MVMMGEIIDAATAEAWGIASWRVDGSAIPVAEELCAKLAKRAPLSLAASKRALVLGGEQGLAFAEERKGFEALLDSADKREGIAAFRAKRKPEFKGE
jgi:enoyl-CoA hydratase